MASIDRIEGIILEELAQALNREGVMPEALITISYVNCSPDLKEAKVGISVLPDNLAGTALTRLNASTRLLVARASQRLSLRRMPKLIWEFDATEKKAEEIERLISEANN